MKNQSSSDIITPQYVLSLTAPTRQYLCPVQANIYGIQFIYFKIRNYENNTTLCQISKKAEDLGKPQTQNSRLVKYHFGPFFFMLNMIGTTLKFRVGGKAVKNLKMIERHYFKNKLIKSYEFTFPFCMPNSTNEMQAIYQLPTFQVQEIQEMINHPWETIADSFYFVQDKLVMHTRALFSYAESAVNQQMLNPPQMITK